MDPISAITTALTSIKTASEIARLLIDADVSLEKAELKLKLAEIVDALASAKLQMADTKQIVADKDVTIARLQEALDLKGRMVLRDSAYWLLDEQQDKIVDGPFCTNCYEADRIKRTLLPDKDEPQVKCPNCKIVFCSKPVFNYLRPDVEESRKELRQMLKSRRIEPSF